MEDGRATVLNQARGAKGSRSTWSPDKEADRSLQRWTWASLKSLTDWKSLKSARARSESEVGVIIPGTCLAGVII